MRENDYLGLEMLQEYLSARARGAETVPSEVARVFYTTLPT